MAENLGLGYDLFDAIMLAREVQAKNMALKLVKLAKENDLPINCCSQAINGTTGIPENDCSCLSNGCSTAKQLQLNNPECNEHDCGGNQEFDCCPSETEAIVECGEEVPG